VFISHATVADVSSIQISAISTSISGVCKHALIRRVVDVLDGIQRRWCSGGFSVPEMPPLEALQLRSRFPDHHHHHHHGALPICHASGSPKGPGRPHPLCSRHSHPLSWYHHAHTLLGFSQKCILIGRKKKC
jgi:hypothetical protein